MSEQRDWESSSYVIDSDVLIDHLRGYRGALDFIDSLILDGAEVCFSVISEAEIYSNVQPGEEARTLALFEALTRLNVNGVIARKAGEYRALYGRIHGMALPDALIAATALVHQSTLIARNTRHYPMSDIQVVMPFEIK